MRRYLLGFFATLLLLLLGWIGLFEYRLGRPSADNRVLAAYLQKKLERAESLREPKLILAGGSGVLFSYSARELENCVGRPAVNLGAHAGLEIPYLLDLAERSARAGDIVVLIIEYDMLNYTGALSEKYVDYVTSFDPAHVRRLPLRRYLQLALSMDLLGLQHKSTSLIQRAFLETTDVSPEVMQRFGEDLNAWGDAMMASAQTRPDAFLEKVRRESPARLDFPVQGPAWEALEGFLQRMAAREVRVVATWPVTVEHPIYASPRAQTAFASIQSFFKEHGVPVIGEPAEVLYPPEYFFDTRYHMLREWRHLPTEHLCAGLKTVLAP